MIKNLFSQLIPASMLRRKAQRQFYSINLGRTDIAIDCGANVGDITQHLSKSGTTVYSFEPNPYAFKILQERFSTTTNVRCIPKGVDDQESKQKLYLHENSDEDEVYWSTGSSLLNFKGNVLVDKYVEVEVVDLCEFIESLNQRVRILKMDVEGVECRILKKIINSGIIDKIDYIFVEAHDRKVPELREETDAIRDVIQKRKYVNINLHWE